MHGPPLTARGRGPGKYLLTASTSSVLRHAGPLPLAAGGDELTQLCQHEMGSGCDGSGVTAAMHGAVHQLGDRVGEESLAEINLD